METGTTTTEPSRSEHEILLAGFLGGFAKILVETTLAPLVLMRPWAVLRRTAAIVLGRGVVSPHVGFGIGRGVIALLVHFTLSLVYAYILIAVGRRFGRLVGISIGIAGGVLLYFVNLYGFTALFPWFADVRGLLQLVSHAIFGATVMLVFFAFHPQPTLLERAPPAPESGGHMVL